MRRRTFHAPHPFGKINVTPMIDVVMVLIIFYLIVGKLVADKRSEVRLPESRAGATDPAADRLVINVLEAPESARGVRIVVDGRDVHPDFLEPLVRERVGASPATVVHIRAARDLPFGSVSSVARACRGAGVSTVRLATERAP